VDALDHARLEVKPSDSRSQTYIAGHGDRCWEVDILPATIIEQELDAHIHSWLNERLQRQRVSVSFATLAKPPPRAHRRTVILSSLNQKLRNVGPCFSHPFKTGVCVPFAIGPIFRRRTSRPLRKN